MSSSGFVLSSVVAAGTTLGTATAIAPGVAYIQVGTAIAAGTAGIALPPIIQSGQLVTIRNDGLGCCLVYGNNVLVAINGLVAGSGWYVGANGGLVQFISAGTNQWLVLSDDGQKTIPIATATVALTLTNAHSGAILAFPAMAGACTITVPAPSSGFNFKAIMTGTAGNAISFTSSATSICGILEIVVAGATACTGIAFAAAGQTTVRFSATAIRGDVLEFQATDLVHNVKGLGAAAGSFSVA